MDELRSDSGNSNTFGWVLNSTELYDVLGRMMSEACELGSQSAIETPTLRDQIEFVAKCGSNRAGVRLLMACLLAKIDQPHVDPREPYTEIGGKKSFSGRAYDEEFISRFITEHELPCNSTTAFLTPALRNIYERLTTTTRIVGKPEELYVGALAVLDAVAKNRIDATPVFVELLRHLVRIRDERRSRINALIDELNAGADKPPLSSEEIVTLLRQHLACKNASRLPVLLVAAAYESVSDRVREKRRALHAHNAADEQTGAMGDIEICAVNDDQVVTAYEMKNKRVVKDDIDRAVQKLGESGRRIDNYLFVTTDDVTPEVAEYAARMYDETRGIEIAVLDCVGFARHFLHFFHRSRMQFLDAYQTLVLAEPASAVPHALKEAFLALRRSAESAE